MATPIDEPGQRLPWALAAGGSYLVLAAIISVCNYQHLARALPIEPSWWSPPITLPLLFGEHIVVATLIAVGWSAAAPRRWPRRVALMLTAVFFVALAIDQSTYSLFFGHLDAHLYRENHAIGSLFPSYLAAIDGYAVATFASAAGLLTGLARGRLPQRLVPIARRVRHHWALTVALLSVWAASTWWLREAGDQLGLDRSLPFEFVASFFDDDALHDAPVMDRKAWLAPSNLVGTPAPTDDLEDARRQLTTGVRPLNVVHVVLESTPLRETSLLDGPSVSDTTPFLRELARRSLWFPRFYATFPGSTRSNFAMDTGLFPYPGNESALGARSGIPVETLSDLLAKQGYATALFASGDTWLDGYDSFLEPHSWDEYVDINSFDTNERSEHAGNSWGLAEEVVIDRALAWTKQRHERGDKFFLKYISTYPHYPYVVPGSSPPTGDKDDDKDARQGYREALRYADASIERLVGGLQRIGVDQDTLVIITPDHGEAFGDLHRGNRFHLRHVYEENVHIFAIFASPRLEPRERKSLRLGTHADLVPTVLDLLGIDDATERHGRSLFAPDFTERTLALYSTSRGNLGLVDGQYKFVMHRKKPPELFDLSTDPDEQQDIAGEHPDLVARYRRYAASWKATLDDDDIRRVASSSGPESKATRSARRHARFGAPKAAVASLSVCPTRLIADCRSSDTPPLFGVGDPLSMRIDWHHPGRHIAKIRITDPKGKDILDDRVLLDGDDGWSAVAIPSPKRWRDGEYDVSVRVNHKRTRASFVVDKSRFADG